MSMSSAHVLMVTNSNDVTADYLCSRLERNGIQFSRLNTDTDCRTAMFHYWAGDSRLEWRNNICMPEGISSVVFRRPVPLQITKNGDPYSERHTAGEWAEALEGFLAHIEERRWVNYPARNWGASHKVEQLSRARKHGLCIPRTLVTNKPSEAEEFLLQEAAGLVVKPLASGFIERSYPEEDTIIYTSKFTKEHQGLLQRIVSCPVLFQEMILKVVDVRVTILDGSIVSTGIRTPEKNGNQRLDVRRDEMSGAKYFSIEMPPDLVAKVQALILSYGLRFATLDFGVTELGEWYFFEINPNGQWAWLDLCGATDIASLFVEHLKGC